MQIKKIIGFILLRVILLIVLGIFIIYRANVLADQSFFLSGPFIYQYILPLLVIIGAILLFSLTGAIMISIGAIITLLFMTPIPTTLSVNPWGAIAFIGLALMAIGIIYGLMEGIIKLSKLNKK